MFAEYMKTHDFKAMLLPPASWRPFPLRGDRTAWESLTERQKKALIEWGEEAQQGYPMLTATQFLAFSRNGSREIFETPYFDRRRKLMGAVLAECVQDDGSFMDAVVDGLWCMLEETVWFISAHNGSDHPGTKPMNERPLPDEDNPYLDLFAAQTAATMAWTLYFLGDKLDAVSPLIARRVRKEIDRRVLIPFMTHDDFWWMGIVRPDINNWTPWIISNVLTCVLLLERDSGRLFDFFERALPMLDRYLDTLPADGGCDEGAAYFNVAGLALFDCLECIWEVTGGKVSFYGEEKIRNVALYPLRAHVSGLYFLNFADCDAKPQLDGTRMAQFAERVGSKELLHLASWLRKQDGEDVRPKDTPQMNRVLFNLFAQRYEAEEPEQVERMVLPDLQVYAWRRNGLYGAIKGSHNAQSHNHNDVGTFLCYVDGEPEIVDMGNKIYTAKTFGPLRYTLDNTRSKNHNVPMIGEFEQQEGRKHCARHVVCEEDSVRMDIASAYPMEAGVRRLERKLSANVLGFTLKDAVEIEKPLPVSWVFMLRHIPEIRDGCAYFGKIKMTWDEELAAVVEEMPVTDERMSRNFPGMLYRLTLTSAPNRCHAQTFRIIRR